MNKSKELITKFKLPGYIAGKSFAEASNLINKKFEGRNDLISKNTKEELLTRLANAQEHVKSLENPEQTDQNQMFLGGMVGGLGSMGEAASTASTAGSMMGSSAGSGMGMNAVNALGSMGAGLPNNMNTSNTPMSAKEIQQANAWEGTKDAMGSVPVIGMFAKAGRAAEKLGKGIGQAVGGDKGGDFAKGFLDPISNVMSKDTNVGEKALSIMDPVVSGIIMKQKNEKRRDEANFKQSVIAKNNYTNDFAKGGPIVAPPVTAYDNGQPLTIDPYFVPPPIEAYDDGSTPIIDGFNNPEDWYKNNPAYMTLDRMNPGVDNRTNPYVLPKTNLSKIGKSIKENYGEALRYAPVLSNAIQLAKLKKSPYERLDRLDARFKPEYVDEKSLQNIIGNEFDNTINSLTNATNGSAGTLRNNILGAGINRTKAMSDAYLKASEANRNMNITGQQFNIGVDQTNLNQSNTENDINARNLAAYESNKSKLTADLATSVGQIGKEQVFKKYPKMMGLGYNWNGKYFVNSETGDTKTEAEAKQLESTNNTNTKSKGGYLSKDVISHINNMYINRKK